MIKKLVCDIDGILTLETKGFGPDYYPKRTPNQYSINTLKDYSSRGFSITLYSARYPEDLDITTKWLDKYKVPYDNLILGKPQADIYADDKAVCQLDREVLLFSGGVDSLIAFHFLQEPKPIYIKMNHRYQEKEIAAVKELEKLIPSLNVEYIQGPHLGQFEFGDSAYIPQRNFHLALLASHFGNKIYIVGIKGDNVPDKSPAAFKTMSFAMNFVKKPDEPRIKIVSPFWNKTKPDIINWFIHNYPRAYVEKVLKTSVSCYDQNTMGSCGNCFACARKWLSLEYCGIKSYNWFERDIRKFKGLKEYVKRIKLGQYDIKRAQETRQVLEKYNLW